MSWVIKPITLHRRSEMTSAMNIRPVIQQNIIWLIAID